MAFVFLLLCTFSYADPLRRSSLSFLRLKRTLEQAQPSMAKRLKAGAASKEPGLWFTFGICDILALAIVVTGLYSLFCRLLRLPTSSRRRERSASSRAYPVAADVW